MCEVLGKPRHPGDCAGVQLEERRTVIFRRHARARCWAGRERNGRQACFRRAPHVMRWVDGERNNRQARFGERGHIRRGASLGVPATAICNQRRGAQSFSTDVRMQGAGRDVKETADSRLSEAAGMQGAGRAAKGTAGKPVSQGAGMQGAGRGVKETAGYAVSGGRAHVRRGASRERNGRRSSFRGRGHAECWAGRERNGRQSCFRDFYSKTGQISYPPMWAMVTPAPPSFSSASSKELTYGLSLTRGAHGLTHAACAFAMDDAHERQPGRVSLLEVLVQLVDAVLHQLAAQVDLHAGRGGDGRLAGLEADSARLEGGREAGAV